MSSSFVARVGASNVGFARLANAYAQAATFFSRHVRLGMCVALVLCGANQAALAQTIGNTQFIALSPTATQGTVGTGGTFVAGINYTVKAASMDAVDMVRLMEGATELKRMTYTVTFDSFGEPKNLQRNNTLTASLGPGTHVLYLKVHTFNGGGEDDSPSYTIVVSGPNSAPTASLSAPGNGASYTLARGASTMGVAVTGSGSDVDGNLSSVDVVVDNTTVQTISGGSVNTSITLGQGSHTVKLVAKDSAGLTGASGTSTITVNPAPNGPPTASLSAPGNGATFTLASGASTMSVGITGSASDLDGNLSSVDVVVDNTTVQNIGGGSVNTSVTLGQGTHTIRLTARDAAGLTGDSATSTITVNPAPNSAPTASLSAPGNGATFTLASGASTMSVAVTGSASDIDGNFSSVDVVVDNATVQTFTSGSVNTSVTLGQGTHTVKLVARDASGATGSSATSTITVNPAPNSAPTASMSAPANGVSYTLATGHTTMGVTVTGSASDIDGNLSSIDVVVDNTTVQNIGGSSVNTTVTLASGTHTIKLVARDAAGATGASSTASVTINPAPPTGVEFISVSATTTGGMADSSGTLTAGITYSVRATGMDEVDKVMLMEGSTVLDSITYTVSRNSAGEPINLTRSNTRSAQLGVGTHQIFLRVHTVDGDVLADSGTFTVTVSPPNVAPTASLSAPSNGATLTMASGASTMSVAITGSAADSNGNLSSVDVVVDNTTVQTINGGSVSTSVTLGQGSHTVKLVAKDALGLTGSSSTSTFTVNPAPNSAPTASLTAPSNGATLTLASGASTMSVAITGGASDIDGNLSSVDVVVDNATVQTITGGTVNTSVTLGQGTHTIKLVAKDASAATGSSATSTITINPAPNSAPTASLTAPSNGATLTLARGASTMSVAVTGSASDIDGNLSSVDVVVDNTTVQTITGGTVNTTVTLGQGSHTIKLVAKDASAATGSSATSTITVNAAPNGAPTASLTAPSNGATLTLASGASTMSVAVTGSASDLDGNLSSVDVVVDNTTVQTISGGTVNTTVTLGQGSHTIKLVAKDAPGLTASSATSTITINPAPNSAPTASLTAPSNGATLTLARGASTMSVAVTGSASDIDGNLSSVDVVVDNTTVQTITGGTVNTTVTLGQGSHTIKLVAKDASAATGSSATATITVNAAPNGAPTASLTAPSNGSTLTLASGASTMSVAVTGSASDLDGNLSSVDVVVDNATVQTISGGTVNTTVTLGQGSHTVKLVAKDAPGLTASSSTSTITINPAPNSAPTASLSAPSNGATLTLSLGASTMSVTIAGSASDIDGNLSSVDVVVDNATVQTITGGSVSSSATLGLGSHTIKLVAKDASGATGASATSTITINPAPDVPIPVSIAPPHLNNADAGTLPGKLSVGSNGDTTYGVQITVPPGTAGMVPELALSYSSHGGPSIAGQGWSLSGLSTVHRCAKTAAQDNEAGRIRFDQGDRLCLDGQRLMRSNGTDNTDAAYWAADAEYRTELESFARVTRQGNGFKVERRNGRVQYYGTDASSLILAQGRSDGQALLWALARTEDRKGNFIAYTYQTDSNTGEYLLKQISYGGNPNAAPAQQSPDLAVRFEYEARPDVQMRYFGGSRTDSRSRLTHVKTFIGIAADGTGGVIVNDYALTYVQGALSGSSLLDHVQLCARGSQTGQTECLPATQFSYGVAAPLQFATVAATPVEPAFTNAYLFKGFKGDLDASGRTSFIVANTVKKCDGGLSDCPGATQDPESTKPWAIFTGELRYSLPGGRVVTRNYPQLAGGSTLVFADLDGDGRDDMIVASIVPATMGALSVCMNRPGADGDPDFSCSPWTTSYVPVPIDLKNDRRMHLLLNHADDCVYVGGASVMSCSPFPMVSRTAPLPPFTSILDQPFFNPVSIEFGRRDVSDLYSVWHKRSTSAQNDATSFGNIYQGVTVCWAGNPTVCDTPYQAEDLQGLNLPPISGTAGAGDLNGDGLSDFVYQIQGDGVYVCLSKETGVDCRKVDVPWGASVSQQLSLGDFLGDGVTRLYAYIRPNAPSDDGAIGYICRLVDVSFTCQNAPFIPTAGYLGPLSIVGSGVADFVYRTANVDPVTGYSPLSTYTMAVAPGTDKLIAVTNGIGYREEADYARANDSATYKRFADGIQPVYPQIARSPGVLTSTQRHSNGQGGWRSESFFYAGAMSDAFGRGSLGFSQVTSTEASSGIATTTTFRQAFPHIGTGTGVQVKAANGVTLSDTQYTLDQQNIKALPGGASTVFAFVKSQTGTKADLSGDSLGTQSVSSVYGDGWGNLTDQTTEASLNGQTFSAQTTTVYNNDETRWLLGLPTSVAVKKTDPVSGTLTRTQATDYDWTTGLPRTQTQEPGDATLQVVTTLDRTRNPYGLVNKTTQDWVDPSPVNGGNKSRTVSDITFDDRGRFPQTTKNAVGFSEQRSFDAATGAMTSHTDVNGLTTTVQVNAFGRLTSGQTTDGTVTKSYLKQCDADCPGYAVLAAITDVFNGSDRIHVPTVQYMDDAGHKLRDLTWGFDGRGIVIDTRYDSLGRVYEVDQPHYTDGTAYLASRHGYDLLGRITSVTSRDDDGVERSATTVYRGPIREIRDGKQQLRTETRDALGQLAQVVDPKLGITQFGYDPFGNLARTVDPNGNVIVVGYDRLGRKTSLNDPDLGLIEYGVDPLGQTWWQRSANQRAMAGQPGTRTEFDLLGRMTGRYEPDLESHWVFDTAANGKGHLDEAYTIANGVKDYRRLHSYDSLSRPSTTTQVLTDASYASTQEYDAWGRPKKLTLRRGSDAAKEFVQRYNGQGYLSQVDRNGSAIRTVQAQDASQRVTQALLGNGLTQTRGYSVYSGRPLNNWLSTGTGAQRLSEGYVYDMLGNIKQRQLAWDGAGFSENFDYDELNRLKTSQVLGQAQQSFGYDAAGNMTAKTDVGTYVYGPQGPGAVRPHAVTQITDGANTAFGYDDNGNLLNGAGRSVSWTSFDMPRTITKGAVSATFAYGPEHQRARQTRGDGGSVVYAGAQEVETSGGVTTVRTYWPMGLGFEADRVGGSTGTQLYWRHMDWLGSPVALSDANGNLAEKMSYDAWGQRRTLDGSATPPTLDGVLDNKGFTGHEMLDQLDLVHMNGRVYDPLVARFMSADPLVGDPANGQAYNRFSYVNNNPTNLTDPSGFDSLPSPEQRSQIKKALRTLTAEDRFKIMTGQAELKINLKDGSYVVIQLGDDGKLGSKLTEAGGTASSASGDAKATSERAGNGASGGDSRPSSTGPADRCGGYICVDQTTGTATPLNYDDSRGGAVNQQIANLVAGVWNGGQKVASYWAAATLFVLGGGEVEGGAALAAKCVCCFVAGTPVLTDQGPMPIEQVRVGTLVQARDEVTGATALKPVTALIHNEGRQIYALTLLERSGKSTRLEVSANHPFWVEGKGWVESAQLMRGMKVATFAGQAVTVVNLEDLGRTEATFNLTVADYHTFFAGDSAVYVHNAGGCCVSGAAVFAASLPFRNGDVILREFSTSKGILDFAAEVLISGRTLHLKDIAVFPRGTEALELGVREVAALRNQLAQEARALGFDQLRITGTRVSGANPGKAVDVAVDLTKLGQ